MATTIRLKDKAYNGTHRLRFVIKKNSLIWSEIDSVIAYFLKPDRGTSLQRSLVAEDAANGIWYYDTVSGDLNQEGYWTMTLEVTDGSVILEYPYEVSFRVNNQP